MDPQPQGMEAFGGWQHHKTYQFILDVSLKGGDLRMLIIYQRHLEICSMMEQANIIAHSTVRTIISLIWTNVCCFALGAAKIQNNTKEHTHVEHKTPHQLSP